MTKDTKILFLSAAAGVTFMLGVLTGDHFGQKKGYSAGAFDAYCEYLTEIDCLSAEYRQAIDDYRARPFAVSPEEPPRALPSSLDCNCKDSTQRNIMLTDSLISEFYKASHKAALEARETTKHLRPR